MHENKISDKVYRLATNGQSVSSEFGKDSMLSPGETATKLYGSNSLKAAKPHPAPNRRIPATQEDLERAKQCANFGDTNPSELFLRAYHDLLCCMEHDPMAGVVSPPLLGTTGIAPFTVIGSLHDTVRHWSNVIVRARKEVLFATNFWKSSGGSHLVTDALIELSKRASQRGERVVVKIMYDRGDVRQLIDPHHNTKPSVYTGQYVQIPGPDEVPNLDLQVVNYHQPPLGTFHAKFMIIDREIACLSSNNIQDNDNLECTSHLEGPIVDSVWDTFILSWHNAMNPAPPLADRLAASNPTPTMEQESFRTLFDNEGKFRVPENQTSTKSIPEHQPGNPHYDDDIAGEIQRTYSMLLPNKGESHVDVVARHLNETTKQTLKATAPTQSDHSLYFFPAIPLPSITPVPMAMASRRPTGNIFQQNVYMPQNEAFLSLIRNAQHSIFIQTPDLNAAPLLQAITDAVRRGITFTAYLCLGYNNAGELMPGQGGTNEMFAKSLYDNLRAGHSKASASKASSSSSSPPQSTEPLDALLDRLRIHYYTAYDQIAPLDNSLKQRSCHIKLMIADERVLVQGSGNQDTQSWYQSQEVNVMVDSPEVCRAWREGIERNQNTGRFGRASSVDGCWHHPQTGELPKGSQGATPGRFAMLSGVKGMFNKARGQ